MLTNATIDKLIEMKLTAMADALRIQLDDPKMNEVNFEDRFSMLVDIEYSKRKDNRLKRLIKKAEFEQPDATIAGINYGAGRKLNRDLIDRLSTCEYISEYRNIFIIGAAGSGKTYLACAFGLAACMHYYKVRFVRLPDLLIELMPLVGTDAFAKAIKQYTNPRLLIIDEWLLRPLSESEAYDLLEIIEVCSREGAMIFCTQYDTDEWYYRIDCDRPEGDDSAVAEAVLDRIIHNKYSINVRGRISMRKRHAFAESEESGVCSNE